MKCPVCLTETNDSVCPNCGMTLKKGHVNTFDSSSYDHDHIQVKHSNARKNNDHLKPKVAIIMITVFVVVCMAFGIIFIANMTSRSMNLQMSFEEIVESGEDINNNVWNMVEYRNEWISLLEDNQYLYSIEEKYSQHLFGNSSTATCIINIENDTYADYEVEIVYKDGQLYDVKIMISGLVANSVDHHELIDEKLLNLLGKKIRINNLVNEIKEGFLLMERDYSGTMFYENDFDYHLYMSEEQVKIVNAPSDSYEFDYIISLK